MFYVRHKETGAVSKVVAKPGLGKHSNYELVDKSALVTALPAITSSAPVDNGDLAAGVDGSEDNR